MVQDNIVKDASGMITITGTACNGGFGIEEKNELGTYTYIIEDMYPEQGDYDMNDIVVSMTASQQESKLTIEGQLKAVGASYKIVPYVEVDNKTQPLFSDEQGNALEAHLVLAKDENSSALINTINDQPSHPAQSFKLEFDGVKKGLNMDDIDFYIEVNGTRIHWNTQDKEKRATWGMRIPGNEFKWPQETVSITKAYSNFTQWFEDPTYDWYNHSNPSQVYTPQ